MDKITRDRKNKWKLISHRVCHVLNRKLLLLILSHWKVQSHTTIMTLQSHCIKKHRRIFNYWWICTRETHRNIVSWRDNRTKLIIFKSWRKNAQVFVRLCSYSHSMRSKRLIRSSLKYWRHACEILSNLRDEERKYKRETVHKLRKQKVESFIKCLNHRVQSQSRLKVENLAVDDKENTVNSSDKIFDQKFKTRQRVKSQQSFVIKPPVDKRIDKIQQRDEEERDAFLCKKREDRMKRDKRQAELERRKKASELAKIHKDLYLLRATLNAFKVVVQNRRIHECKADNLYKDTKMLQCFEIIRKNISWRRSERLEMSRRKFKMADSYHECKLYERVLIVWKNLAYRTHSVNFPRACERSMYYRKRDLVRFWIDALVRQRCHRISQVSMARLKGEMIIQKFSLRQWKQRVDEVIAKRVEEEKIKEKWNMVRKWLSEDEIQ